MDNYYVKDKGEEKGPFTFDELTDDRLEPDDLVRPDTADTWTKASDMPDFDEYFRYQGYCFPTEANLAGFGIRLLAFLIDHISYSFAIGIGIAVYNAYQPAGQIFDLYTVKDRETLQLVIAPIIIAVYNTLFIAFNGATLGQMLCKLTVVDAEGIRPGFFKALIRGIGKLFSLIFFGIGFVSILFSAHKQAFHDAIARTYVVRKDVF